MTSTMADLGLPNHLLDALAAEGITAPFPIQASSIPAILSGSDVSGRAPTGSGKTLAFGLPMIARVGVAEPNRPKALILSPTRELAAQIRKELAPYGKASRRQVFAIYGGVRYAAQIDWLRRGVDVLVATPGRLEDLIDQGALTLSDVHIVAVDEADRMADMGFLPAVKRIIDQTPRDRQTLLFSATLDGDVKELVRRYQKDPITTEAGSDGSDAIDAEHLFWSVDHKDKPEHAAQIVNATGNAIVFTRTRHGADRLARQIQKHGVKATAIHGGLSQGRRNRALAEFKNGSVDALIATDVAARGIHVDGVSSVVHFDPPNGHKDYVHRSGRTARAGATGVVVSLVTNGERRATIRMQRNLDLDVPIAKPSVHHLFSIGYSDDRGPAATSPRPSKAPTVKATPAKPAAAKPASDRPKREKRQKGASDRGGANGELVVSNLPWATTDADLRRMFGTHGTVLSAAVKQDRRGRSKGVGIVRMRGAAATNAALALDGRRVSGRPMKVRRGTQPA